MVNAHGAKEIALDHCTSHMVVQQKGECMNCKNLIEAIQAAFERAAVMAESRAKMADSEGEREMCWNIAEHIRGLK